MSRRWWLLGVFAAMFILLVYSYGHFIEPYRLEVTHLSLESGKLKSGMIRIVQISDLHCDKMVRNEENLVRLVKPMNPDVIVFTGDMANTLEAVPYCQEVLGRLNARLGKYAVRGNWDSVYWGKIELFNNTGFTELKGATVRLVKDGNVFYITGLPYGYSDRQFDVLFSIPSDGYSILLYHNPDIVKDLKNTSVDLYLAGHTHGGQIALPFYGAIITLSKYGKAYEAGLYQVGGVTLYVNRGIGLEGGWAPRMRLFARPEIAVFDIVPAGGSSA